ncbi:unnamed protein product, partial [Dicrocoelium dendriticum]
LRCSPRSNGHFDVREDGFIVMWFARNSVLILVTNVKDTKARVRAKLLYQHIPTAFLIVSMEYNIRNMEPH